MEVSKNNTQIGEIGEKYALAYLESQGFTIKALNWRYKHKEIDIIAEKDDFLIIVEVKTRSMYYVEGPLAAVNKSKQKFLIEAANAYIEKYNIEKETRFDVVSVLLDGENYKIEHIDDAFYPLV